MQLFFVDVCNCAWRWHILVVKTWIQLPLRCGLVDKCCKGTCASPFRTAVIRSEACLAADASNYGMWMESAEEASKGGQVDEIVRILPGKTACRFSRLIA